MLTTYNENIKMIYFLTLKITKLRHTCTEYTSTSHKIIKKNQIIYFTWKVLHLTYLHSNNHKFITI